MKIVFMGTPSYATVVFENLLQENFNLVALFTQPDKKVGRKQVLTASHIKQFCKEIGLSIPIYQPNNLKDDNIVKIIKNLKPDFIVVCAYGKILPQSILEIAPCINLHASLLPKYRGASPIQEAILNNDKYTGVTAMLMDKSLDSGDILGYKYLKITPTLDTPSAFNKLSIVASKLIIYILKNYDELKPKKQNLLDASYCSKIKRGDGLIVFNNASIIYQKFKAYKIWPEIFLDSLLKIKECKLVETISINKAGIILEILKDSIIIGCSIGSLQIFKVQPPSKKVMNVIDYIRGVRKNIGDIF